MNKEDKIIDRLDEIVSLLRIIAKPEPLPLKIAHIFGLAVSILGVLAIIDILRDWLGG